MSSYRFKARPTTAGAYALIQPAIAAAADYPPVSDVEGGVIFGNDSLTGTLVVGVGVITPLTTPTLSLENDETGTSATATITSASGVLNTLYYKAQTDAFWTAGETITGSGTVQQTGLNPLTTYLFQAVSADTTTGALSLPSNAVTVLVSDAMTLTKDAIAAQIASLLQTLVPLNLSTVQRPVSGGWLASPKNKACYILQGNLRAPENEENDSEGENLRVTSIQPYDLYLFSVQSDSDITPVDDIINMMEAAVVAAILNADGTDNISPAVNAMIGAVWFDPVATYGRNLNNSNIFFAIKKLLVEFTHPQNSLVVNS